MPNENRPIGTALADSAKAAGHEASDRTAKAKDAVSNMARTAADRLSDTRATTADGLDTAASALHKGADNLPGGDTVSGLAHSAADRLSTTADYVRRNDVNRMMADVETLVKNNPGPSLVIAAAFGFLLGRAVIRD
jgi:ElaB/YqjD/DUF883 family membrane-anchored ribosome-binding protein